MNNSLIAPCGMNCGICLAHLREKNICNGCWVDNKYKPQHCVRCVIKNCELLAKIESKFCFDCPKYPCARLKQLDKRYRANYKMSMIDNLESIKTDGLDRFVQKEQNRWNCNNCGGTICVHRGFCLNCK